MADQKSFLVEKPMDEHLAEEGQLQRPRTNVENGNSNCEMVLGFQLIERV